MAHNLSNTVVTPKVTFNIRLAHAVEKYPNIYNYQLGTYSNRQQKQEAWKMVAAELGSTVARCKEKWRNMRICYTEYIRKYVDDTPEVLNTRSYLTEIMKFLRPFIRTRDDYTSVEPATSDIQTVLNIITPKLENTDEIEIISDEETPVGDKKFAILDVSPAIEEIQDSYISTELPDLIPFKQCYTEFSNSDRKELLNSNPRHQFLMSILPDLEKMNDRQMRKFRSRVSTAIEEILEDE